MHLLFPDFSVSTLVLNLLLAFIIAGNTLLGAMVGELLENIRVVYLGRFYVTSDDN